MSTTIYLDIETKRSTHEPDPWLPGYPEPLPERDDWIQQQLDALGPPPTEADARAKVPRNWKNEDLIAKRVRENLERLQEDYDKQVPKLEAAYDVLVQRHQAAMATLHQRSSLDPYFGGTVWCIGIASGDNDPKLISSRELGGELGVLDYLQKGLRQIEDDGRKQARIVAYNGLGFDYNFISKAAARNGLPMLAGRFFHGVPWKAEKKGLTDPREAWLFGDRRRPGTLLGVAHFFEFEVPRWYLKLEGTNPADLIETDPDAAERKCLFDVELLRKVDHEMQVLGWAA